MAGRVSARVGGEATAGRIAALVCMRCGKKSGGGPDAPCPSCGPEGVVEIQFDLAHARRTLTRRSLAQRSRDVWRYRELLPVPLRARLPALRPGMTPLVEAPRLADWVGVRRLLVKDESRNPTASFKDRASVVGVARALHNGARVIACASTGNAASSTAGAAASVGMRAVIFVPEFAPEPKVAQLLVFGARVIRVKGSYDETWEMCQRACARYGWYNRNAAVNPSLVEGKKTCGLEIAEELGMNPPDWVAVSVGDGCTIAGIWKGLVEMKALGFISRLPRLLGVQAEGARPLVDAFAGGGDLRAGSADTIADSISVGHPRNWRKALAAVRASQGTLLAVSDDAILDALRESGKRAGLFGEPAAVAALAGLRHAVASGCVSQRASVVSVMTGGGLKDVKTAIGAVGSPVNLPPDDGQLRAYLEEHPIA